MKKTLLVTTDFYPDTGGVANYLAKLALELPEDKIVFLAPNKPDAIDESFGRKIYRRNFFWWVWPKWLPMIWQIYKVCKKEKIEMLWSAQILPTGTAVYLVSKFLKIPYIVNTHGMDVKQFIFKKDRRAWLAKKVLFNAKVVTATTLNTKSLCLEFGVSEKNIVIIWPGLGSVKEPDQKVMAELRQKYNLSGKKVLLSVGRLVARKGHDKVIEAMPEVLKKVPETLYIIAGDGPNRDNLLELIKRLNLSQNVIMTGRAPDEDVWALYGLCSAFIMPSREEVGGDVEGFGVVFLEAGYFGKPSIGGKSGGQAEAIKDGETGLLVDPLNITEIAEAIIKLMTDDDLNKKLGEAGRERVARDFRWEVEGDKVKEILE